MNKLIKTGLLFAALGILLSCQNDTYIPKEGKVREYEGWELTWNDEFDEETVNLGNWTFEIGDGTAYGLPAGWGNDEKQIYTDSELNAFITEDEGFSVLAIQAVKDNSDEYSSARLSTKNLFSTRFGRFEIRAKLAEGQGIWSAIWMLGENRDEINWPGCGEIDIVEVIGHEPNKMYSTLHFTNGENRQDEIQGIYTLTDRSFSEDFHIFRIDWWPDSIAFLVDDILVNRVPIEDDMKEYLRDFNLLLNVAVGGNWPGDPDETTLFPQSMYVDYVRVYSKQGFETPAAPELSVVEETVGQAIEPSIADHAIRDDFEGFGSKTVITYGPGAPVIDSSESAIDGSYSLVLDFPGGNWGGAYIKLEEARDMSTYGYLKFSLNAPAALADAEIKLESGASSAAVYLKDYTPSDVGGGFVEYVIPLVDFNGLDLSQLTIPFAIWNPVDGSEAFVTATVLVDNVYFSL